MTNLHEKCDGNGGITAAKEVMFLPWSVSLPVCVSVGGENSKQNADEFFKGAVCDYQELISCWQ